MVQPMLDRHAGHSFADSRVALTYGYALPVSFDTPTDVRLRPAYLPLTMHGVDPCAAAA